MAGPLRTARAAALAWTAVLLINAPKVAAFGVLNPFVSRLGSTRLQGAACSKVTRPILPVASRSSAIRLRCSSGSESDVSGESVPVPEEDPKTAAVRIVSYNVLSSDLCEADWHVKCSPQNLDQKNRLRKVMGKLENEVEKNAVICLQEVSTKWAGQLHCWFSDRDYHMVHMGYGGKFDGYMGVAMAFPLKTYKLQKCKIERPSDLRRWPRPPSLGFRKRTLNWIQTKWRKFRNIKPPLDAVTDAKRRANQMIIMRLQHRVSGVGFLVGTYHMPCQFRVPQVMVIHMALALRELQLSAQNTPLIWCGDFNVKPGDAPYLLVTEGSLSPSHEHFPPPVPGDKWQPKVEYALRSAYKEAEGEEPALTNWAFTRGSEADFKDTLDYIFISQGIEVDEVESVAAAAAAEGPFPNAEEPSDHVLIAADLTVTANGNTDGRVAARSSARRDSDDDAQLEAFRERVVAFMGDEKQAELAFTSSLNSFERLLIHKLSEQYGLHSASVGQGSVTAVEMGSRSRRITIYKEELT